LGPRAGAQLVMPRVGEPVEPAHAEGAAVVACRRHDRARTRAPHACGDHVAEGYAVADRL